MNRIGSRIREKRKDMKLTQKELSKMCGVTYATIASIENKDKGSLSTFLDICEKLELNIELTDK